MTNQKGHHLKCKHHFSYDERRSVSKLRRQWIRIGLDHKLTTKNGFQQEINNTANGLAEDAIAWKQY